tara:strand:- start:107 stop:580 length:474 start_codon:yes stop_codon:yes gene_type:complete
MCGGMKSPTRYKLMIAVLGRALIDHQGTRKNKKPREFPRRTVRKPKTENQKTENRNKEPPEFQQVFWVVLRRQAGDNVPFGQMFVLDQCVDQGSQHGGHGVHRGIGRDFVGGIVVKAAERREREEKEEKDQELDSYTLVHALHARLLSSKTLPSKCH